MHNTLNNWLEALEKNTSLITSNDINEEAHNNMACFFFSPDMLSNGDKDSVLDFIAGCSEVYRIKKSGEAMVFYAWFDHQAGQIRISAVRSVHNKLPFGCHLNSTDLSQVVNELFNDDSSLYTKGVLNIWCQNI